MTERASRLVRAGLTRRAFLQAGMAVAGGLALPGLMGRTGKLRAANGGNVLHMANEGRDITSLDPQFATTTPTIVMVWSIFDSLVRFPPGVVDFEQIEPSLAERWTHSDDMTEWTFYLRQGVQWHKGYGEFTADDVVFSIERMKDPAVGSPWRNDYQEVVEVTALDRYTVRFRLAAPNPFFLLSLVDYHGGFMLSRKAVEDLGADFALNPVGTGPFQFESYHPQSRVVFSRFDDHFKGAPKLDGIVFHFMPDISSRSLALRRGEVHTAHGVRQQDWIDELESYGLIVEGIPLGSLVTIHFNMTKKPLDDERVRKALAYAISRDEHIQFIGETVAQPAYSPVPTGYFGWTDDVERYDYDPERARQLLVEAGYPNGLTLEAYMSESELYLPFMQVVQEQWRRVGVNLNMTVVDHTTYHRLIRENANHVIAYDASRQPIASVYLEQFYSAPAAIGSPTAITNFSHIGVATPGIDHLLAEANQTLDINRRRELYEQAQREIMEVMAVMPLFMRVGVAVRDPRVDLGYTGRDSLIDHYYYTKDSQLT